MSIRATLSHEADGIYGFSYDQIAAQGACYIALDAIRRYGNRNFPGWTKQTVMPLTAAFALEVHKRVRCGNWIASKMREGDRINADEFLGFRAGYSMGSQVQKDVRLFMDTLARRARREGYL